MKKKKLTKEVILRVIQSRGWFWVDHFKGLVSILSVLEEEGKVIRKFKNKHGIYYVRPTNSRIV
jgi:hypothetical protein